MITPKKRGRPKLYHTDIERLEAAKRYAKKSREKRRDMGKSHKNISVDALTMARLIEFREKLSRTKDTRITNAILIQSMITHCENDKLFLAKNTKIID
tara:strand:+ start:2623 stop:2916 length:294 start_codon:yes stop_codon:yes gene_type:complete